ncbi:hypothetical protein KCTC32516_00569 [Polaribacter huanghezhanensis]|uniref:hypothetical protein n=1 Tax=Polaribacter huanghezhanensis TaxID=1354726 RepID=UPI0026483216|nr:hypothetical protein [Polaribacter huanghezhanensis]WKD85229.1 hypothetical protein KCTC32516_00569 [Polaribacter huanghezhanensis]
MSLTYKERLAQRAKQNRAAFIGLYKNEIEKLHGLSKEEIDSITPDTTDMEVYAQLIAVVEEASATNETQAKLKEQILELGEIAVQIAKKIPSLASLL